MATAKKTKPGLYANIHAKQERIAHGSGEKMRKPGSAGAPQADAFDKAEKTAKKPAAKKASRIVGAGAKPAAKKAPAVKKAAPKTTKK